MADGAEDWQERIRSIAGSLLTLEVNTIEKKNMSAAKMPAVPMALHQLARLYADDLASRRYFVTDELLDLAQARIDDGKDAAKLDRLQAWKPEAGDRESVRVTNGPRTFEALQWVAQAARNELDADADCRVTDVAVDRTLLTRMIVNCRQLRQVSLMLLTQHSTLPGIGPANAKELFDGTIEETTGTLFKQPRPRLQVDTDVLLLVRKAWDIGVEQVMFQTAMQVDGDVLARVAPDMDPVKRAFFAELHRSTVETGLRQWQGLFDLAGALISGVGRALFGRAG